MVAGRYINNDKMKIDNIAYRGGFLRQTSNAAATVPAIGYEGIFNVNLFKTNVVDFNGKKEVYYENCRRNGK